MSIRDCYHGDTMEDCTHIYQMAKAFQHKTARNLCCPRDALMGTRSGQDLSLHVTAILSSAVSGLEQIGNHAIEEKGTHGGYSIIL